MIFRMHYLESQINCHLVAAEQSQPRGQAEASWKRLQTGNWAYRLMYPLLSRALVLFLYSVLMRLVVGNAVAMEHRLEYSSVFDFREDGSKLEHLQNK